MMNWLHSSHSSFIIPHSSFPYKLFHVFGQDVRLQVYGIAHPAHAQVGVLLGEGDHGDDEAALVAGDDGQADAVHGDKALLHDVAHHVGRRLDADQECLVVPVDGGDAAGALDVALDKVAAHATAGSEGAFQVHRVARAQLAKVGPA